MKRYPFQTPLSWPGVVALAATISLVASTARAGENAGSVGEVEVIATFNPYAGELIEGVAVDTDGSIYISLPPLAQVRRINADATQTVVAQLDVPFGFPGFGALGLELDGDGGLYVAMASFNPASHGVWRVDLNGGGAARVPGSEQIIFPDDFAYDEDGNLYVTDLFLGAVWRIPEGGAPELWVMDPRLFGTGELPDDAWPVPVGANGIAYRAGTVYVANSEQGLVASVHIEEDGAAGPVEVVADDLKYLDGMAVDRAGNLYVAALGGVEIAGARTASILRIERDGTVTTIADLADGLDEPASVGFGPQSDATTLYITNFAFRPTAGSNQGPSLMKVDVGIPGIPNIRP